MTAFRVRSVEKYLGDDPELLLTYGDGVGNVDITAAVAQHRQSGKVVTLTAVHPPGRFGELELGPDGAVVSFNEKPQSEGGLINGGFMVCSRSLFQHLPDDPQMMLELGPLKSLAAAGNLGTYVHNGFWQPMDTLQEFNLLNQLWNEGKAPWKVWE